MEFIIIFGIMALFLTGFFVIVYDKVNDVNREKESMLLNNIAWAVRDEINLAGKSSNGYYREFSIPTKINMKDYQINITAGLVHIRTDENSLSYPVGEITGQIKKGKNMIRKENGKIYLN